MQLSGLEIALGSALVGMLSSGATGVLVKLTFGNRYVTQEQCEQRHEHECEQQGLLQNQQKKDMQELKKSIGILFRMNRALVTYSEIPATEKEKILNTNGNGS
jgi:Na+/glutamate symporter